MAIFRASEVSQFSDAELTEQLSKLELELVQDLGKVSAGGAPENPGRIHEVKRTIARIKTEQTKRSKEA
ncbi:ribosomal protein L29 [Methanolacinia petrolearia DSM 11571]|uniref:Large ribosomal subunit protein uL29 n=1 Tax=Methanolacinia petrolearia (strain DSM 11571 / OCM 486 / SEBR 4847) TaxID=679926 RepID=E1RKD0_METP4|nr:50S ribosomal protein L29 [Methanolacinia petrolearia]ADN36943.1 ribosomal protein L29 [Methanolacinia petrolearia DSM 11571]